MVREVKVNGASGGPGSGKRGVCRAAAGLLGGGGSVGCSPRLAPEATRLLPGAQPAVGSVGFAGVLLSPVALPAEARSGFACQARGTTNLGGGACAALSPGPTARCEIVQRRYSPTPPLRGKIPAYEPPHPNPTGIFHTERPIRAPRQNSTPNIHYTRRKPTTPNLPSRFTGRLAAKTPHKPRADPDLLDQRTVHQPGSRN
jgi:hypothetical protein